MIMWRSKSSSYFDLEPVKRANTRADLFLVVCVSWADGWLHSKPAVTVLRGSCSVLRLYSWCYSDLAVENIGSTSSFTGWVLLLTSHQGMMETRKTSTLWTEGESSQKHILTIVSVGNNLATEKYQLCYVIFVNYVLRCFRLLIDKLSKAAVHCFTGIEQAGCMVLR